MRALASASATRDVSIVIQRRPHCSATYAVVPEPQVGSSTRSPGSVVIRIQRSTIFVFVCTTYIFSALNPPWETSVQMLFSGDAEKSSKYLTYPTPPRELIFILPARLIRSIPVSLVSQYPFDGI